MHQPVVEKGEKGEGALVVVVGEAAGVVADGEERVLGVLEERPRRRL